MSDYLFNVQSVFFPDINSKSIQPHQIKQQFNSEMKKNFEYSLINYENLGFLRFGHVSTDLGEIYHQKEYAPVGKYVRIEHTILIPKEEGVGLNIDGTMVLDVLSLGIYHSIKLRLQPGNVSEQILIYSKFENEHQPLSIDQRIEKFYKKPLPLKKSYSLKGYLIDHAESVYGIRGVTMLRKENDKEGRPKAILNFVDGALENTLIDYENNQIPCAYASYGKSGKLNWTRSYVKGKHTSTMMFGKVVYATVTYSSDGKQQNLVHNELQDFSFNGTTYFARMTKLPHNKKGRTYELWSYERGELLEKFYI